ncbi:MAG: 30S ribosomal protein S6 [Alphaproteobacteria bacterium]|nr:30S ribosomal protein S6 [Alphaproteobacteria bacterium]
MPYYENVFVARQDISSTQVEAIADTMAEIITADGGTVARREYWGLKSLAYRMKKNKKGHFVLFNLDAPIESVREMERQMGLHEDILRFLTLRSDDLPEDASVMMASRSERGGRYGRDRDRGRPEQSDESKASEDAPKAEVAAPKAEVAAPKAEVAAPAGDET